LINFKPHQASVYYKGLEINRINRDHRKYKMASEGQKALVEELKRKFEKDKQ